MPLDEALKTLAFAGAGHVDELAGGEDLRLQLLTGFDSLVVADLDDVVVRIEVCLLELAQLRVVEPALFGRRERDADGLVAVLLSGSQPKHPALPGRDAGHGGRCRRSCPPPGPAPGGHTP